MMNERKQQLMLRHRTCFTKSRRGRQEPFYRASPIFSETYFDTETPVRVGSAELLPPAGPIGVVIGERQRC